MPQTYAYIRVSSRDQREDRQVIALRDKGVPSKNMIKDKQSGKDFLRPGYKRLVRKLKPGDTLIIKSIDRLGRNYHEILEEWRLLTKEKKIRITVLDMPILNTANESDLTATLIADIVLQLLSYVAETERTFIRQRQREGIDAALAKGVRFGKRPLERPPEFNEVRDMWERGEFGSRPAAKKLGVSHTCFLKWISDDRKAEATSL